MVIAVCPPDPGQAEFCSVFLSDFVGRTLENQVEVTALIALSTDVSRRRGELLSLQKIFRGL